MSAATATESDVYYDPYDVDIDADPYPVYRAAARRGAALLQRAARLLRAQPLRRRRTRRSVDTETFISGRGGILELIKAGIEMPPGLLIFEDPPMHTMHRRLLSRVFTPRRMAGARTTDPRVLRAQPRPARRHADEFDFVADLGAQMPMRVIGMLLGIPEADQEAIRDHRQRQPAHRGGQADGGVRRRTSTSASMFADYIDWRAEHPSDDLMTELLHAEFEDETGTVRRLSRRGDPHLRRPSSPAPATRRRRG